MAELWLICEGEPGSADVAILQSVFATVLAAEVVVEGCIPEQWSRGRPSSVG
jgi:hypothetical protein